MSQDEYALRSTFSTPPSEPVVELETAVGPLLLPRHDEVITAVLADGGLWEPDVGAWLASNLRPGHTFVDVGAHVGYFSVLASKLVGTNGSVIAVEPETRNRDLLQRNLVRNECTNAQVMPFAAYSASGEMALELNETNRGAHRLVPLGEAPTSVRCVRLDDVLPAKVDVVKTDAQGYDHDIVEGLQRTIAANPQLLLITELSPEELELRDVEPEAALASYQTLGLELYLLGHEMRSRRASLAETLAACRAGLPATMPVILARPGVTSLSAPALKAFPVQTPGLELREAADGLIVYELGRKRAHRLNDTAAIVFELCTGEHSVAQIVERIQRTYELPDSPAAEVQECLGTLRREGLIA